MAHGGARHAPPWRVAELDAARHGASRSSRTPAMGRALEEGGREGGGAGYRGRGGAPGKEEATGASEVDGGAPACFFGFSLFFSIFAFSCSPSFV